MTKLTIYTTICKLSGQPFIHTDADLAFYEKIGVPPPLLSPSERRRRRFSFRNERFLYKNKSALSGQDIISCVHPNDPWPVYSREEWWSDAWDGTQFGREYDFSKSFFEQYFKLQKVVPAIAINGMNNENCPYANYAAACKNCHLTFGSVYCEDCMYGNPYYCKSCVDSLLVRDSELCYECITCEKCYECMFCQDCAGSYSLLFCYDCHASKNLIGCSGLRNKEYCIFNVQYSKEDFVKYKAALNLCDEAQVAEVKRKFNELKQKTPRRFATTLNTENVTGDYIYSSKNTFESFDVQRCEDTSYCAQVIDMKDCRDCNYTEENELCYEYICNYHNQRVFFCVWMYSCSDAWYSSYCTQSQNLLGCIGLKHKQYCILNKQYTRTEYEELFPRIINQMRQAAGGTNGRHAGQEGIFGEFFPTALSLFAYNETVAQEYFPMTKEDAVSRGYRWREKDPREYAVQTYSVPADIRNVSSSITQEILACRQTPIEPPRLAGGMQGEHPSPVCGKNFQIQKPELNFYKNCGLPIPKNCPDCRHYARLALRNQRTLFERNCSRCQTVISSTYDPSRTEKIYCDNCYLKNIY